MRHFDLAVVAVMLSVALAAPALAQDADTYGGHGQTSANPVKAAKDKWIAGLPKGIGDGLDVEVWGWFADLQNNQKEGDNYWDAELSIGVTKTFDQKLTLSSQINFIDANKTTRIELEQVYASLLIDQDQGSFFTLGKFNANFGVEARDFWSRTTGTTSLLFGAQPQDLVGIMLTQPLGKSGITLRPFISADFQGEFNFDQAPSAGMMVEYSPSHEWNFAATGWIGPGFVLFNGRPISHPYSTAGYDYNGATAGVNWQGPHITAEAGSTLYFLELKATWQARKDLLLSAEFLVATTGASNSGHWGWHGFLVQADYDLTDRWHLFARTSYLNDSDWLITGVFQRAYEVSGGAGYQLFDGVELRGEYRHDFSNVEKGVDSVSIHLDFVF